MFGRTLRLEIIRSVSTKRQQFIILGAVQLVDVQLEGGSGRKVVLLIAERGKTTRGNISEVDNPTS